MDEKCQSHGSMFVAKTSYHGSFLISAGYVARFASNYFINSKTSFFCCFNPIFCWETTVISTVHIFIFAAKKIIQRTSFLRNNYHIIIILPYYPIIYHITIGSPEYSTSTRLLNLLDHHLITMKSPYYYHITIGSSPKIHRNCQVRSPR